MSVNPAQPADANESDKLKMPDDTAAPSASDESKAGRGGSKSGSSLDTVLGRLVVEQGLATNDEVQKAIEERRSLDDPKGKSLAQILIESDYITDRQLQRLKSQLEAERSGQQIPGYRVLGKLGAGAMATVFKAKQLSLDRLVAIKVLPRKFSQNAEFIARFYAEGRIAAQLNHPNIVQAYDVGQAGEFHYFVMEYVEGTTVYDQIVRAKRFKEQEALDIIIQVAEALEHAHAKGLIHRDVKPKNIMMTPQGVAKLADMGLARAVSDKEAAESEAGKAYGTPYYISPEQIRGEKNIGAPADIYSLGATLYHMVTGSVPFDGKSPSAVMHKHLKAELVPADHVNPKLSAGIGQVIELMMAKSASQRYQNCTDLLTDLRAIRRGELPVIARPTVEAQDLSQLAEVEASAEGEIPEDKTRQPSVFAHPLVQGLIVLVILSVVLNVIQVLWLA
jgi:serine/threonine-protein kinase